MIAQSRLAPNKNAPRASSVKETPLQAAPQLPVLALSASNPLARGKPNAHMLVHLSTNDGISHDLAYFYGPAGGPATKIIHAQNHHITEAVEYHWKRIDGGWVVTAMRVTLFKGGKIRLRLQSNTSSTDVATAAVALLRLLLPQLTLRLS